MTQTATHATSTASNADLEAVRTLYRAFSEKNPALVDAVLAADWDDIPLAPGQQPGPAGIKPIIESFGKAFPDVQIVIHDIVQAVEKVAVRAEITGTHEGELFGIAPTGKKVSFRLHEFHKVQNGRIATTWHMEDWFGLFLQLGQFPQQG
ncbi:ester cyclase [Paraburkholderia acidisoli]|uniref:Ester cyclase n=1 Tax=Paraburkholderia acidisoli TaxID=2571748 RepID=A0A7Z2GQR9_9BURK|nr:ester cyclase [Paraburkholderia acidisoli]QGZ66025.1 ester cyclase [Paraburkholderia acidisoli]